MSDEVQTFTDSSPAGLVQAQRLAIQIAEEFTESVTPGMTEREVRDGIDAQVVELGGTGVWTPTVVGFGTGTFSCFPTDIPSEQPLWEIDLGTIDVHPVADHGWWGDCTRALIRGGNIPQQRALDAINSVHTHVLASARPGMRACGDWFAEFQTALEPTGLLLLDRLQNIGHSLAQDSSYDLGYINTQRIVFVTPVTITMVNREDDL